MLTKESNGFKIFNSDRRGRLFDFYISCYFWQASKNNLIYKKKLFDGAFLLLGAFSESAFFESAFFESAFFESAFLKSAFFESAFLESAFSESAFSEYSHQMPPPLRKVLYPALNEEGSIRYVSEKALSKKALSKKAL